MNARESAYAHCCVFGSIVMTVTRTQRSFRGLVNTLSSLPYTARAFANSISESKALILKYQHPFSQPIC